MRRINRTILHESYFVNCIGVIYVFAFIFSFYIVKPITSSIFIAIFIIPLLFSSLSFSKAFIGEFKRTYVFYLFCFQFLLIILSCLFAIFHGSYDFSYSETLFAQFIHSVFGLLIVSFLRYKYGVNTLMISKYIIYAYLVQSVVQLIASSVPSFAEFVWYFNGAEDMSERFNGVRGLALSSSTGWNLALSYGVVFILFTSLYLLKNICLKSFILWLLLFVGTFFAGRTGLVGAVVGLVYFFICNRDKCLKKIFVILSALLILFLLCVMILYFFPLYAMYIQDDVLPFAFEPLYNYLDGNGFTSSSTDTLGDMWSRAKFTLNEFLLGTGYFFTPSGGYVNQIDAGVVRNLYYWGILGYIFLIFYQFYIISPIWKKNINKTFCLFLLVFMCLAEYKAVTFGLNKQVFSILFLLGYFNFVDTSNLSVVDKHV